MYLDPNFGNRCLFMFLVFFCQTVVLAFHYNYNGEKRYKLTSNIISIVLNSPKKQQQSKGVAR